MSNECSISNHLFVMVFLYSVLFIMGYVWFIGDGIKLSSWFPYVKENVSQTIYVWTAVRKGKNSQTFVRVFVQLHLMHIFAQFVRSSTIFAPASLVEQNRNSPPYFCVIV